MNEAKWLHVSNQACISKHVGPRRQETNKVDVQFDWMHEQNLNFTKTI